MRARIIASVIGVLLVTAGLVVSPVPWLAPIVVGVVLASFGLLTDYGKEA